MLQKLQTRWSEHRIRHTDGTLASSVRDGQRQLAESLFRRGVSRPVVNRLMNSGYILRRAYPAAAGWGLATTEAPADVIQDTFYGSKEFFGLLPLEAFVREITHNRPSLHRAVPMIRTVRSVEEAFDVLASGRHIKYMNSGQLTFRGQTREYWTRRQFPNPVLSDENGRERLLVPGFWRRFAQNWQRRFLYQPRHAFAMFNGQLHLNGVFGVPLKDAGKYLKVSVVDDHVVALTTENSWIDIKGQVSVVEQHYGIPTDWLDITFDLNVALFFATHTFEARDGFGSFKPVPRGTHSGVVYCFRFLDPLVTKTSDLIRNVHVLDDYSVIRPLRQSCALRYFSHLEINEAVSDIDLILQLDPHFESHTHVSPQSLFPTALEDTFYGALLDAKRAGWKALDDVVEYRW